MRFVQPSEVPLWRGVGLDIEEERKLEKAGLQLLAPFSDGWIDLQLAFRGQYRSALTQIALCAADIHAATDTCTQRMSHHDQHPPTDSEDDLPCFRTFTKLLPPFSSSAFWLRGGGDERARVRLPRSLVRIWFPNCEYGAHHSMSVKLDGQSAEKQSDVRIWVRLDTGGAQQGRWFELTDFYKDHQCSNSVWAYVCRQRARATNAHIQTDAVRAGTDMPRKKKLRQAIE